MSKTQRINNMRTRALGELDILTIKELASILKMRQVDVKNYVYENNLVKTIIGRPRVIYKDFIQFIEGDSTDIQPTHIYIDADDIEIEEIV